MLEEISKIKGLEVYAPNGFFVGYADRFVIEPSDRRVTGIFLEAANPVLVDKNVSIKIPFRWVQSVGDVIILKSFPNHVYADGKIE